MELIDQRTKKIMQECRKRAEAEGLSVQGETLEYIISNKDMIELSPKIMIPTLYDYWVHDVEVLRDQWIYDVMPHNAYETVINTRPAISFYNDNNPDWMNTMIFYHVLAHIDFFHNNVFFRKTWDDDFCGEALADKRLLNRIREELGSEKRWVDYVIEFARGVDNLVGYYAELEEADEINNGSLGGFSERTDFYFGDFLKKKHEEKAVEIKFYYDELERFNRAVRQFGEKIGESVFFEDPEFKAKFPEFANVLKKREKKEISKPKDILQHLIERSDFINREENKWMKDVLSVVRKTSLYFQPQIRDKIANEGWASLWHERLFIKDERINTHEVGFAIVNSGVLVDPKIGLNPYIIGKRIYEFIEELAEKGKLSYAYQLTKDAEIRKRFDQNPEPGFGKKMLFEARKNLNDYMLVNFLSDDDFQDFMDKHKLFVAGTRFNPESFVYDVYIKSRSGKEYRKILNKSLYHPPYVIISEEKNKGEGKLYLDHVFEGRTLHTPYIPPVLIGLSYLSGGKVRLETTEFETDSEDEWRAMQDPDYVPKYRKNRVLYTCEKKSVTKVLISRGEEEEYYGDE